MSEDPTTAPGSPPARTRARWLRLPRRTVRLRLTLLYGGVFMVSGCALLATTYVLVGQTARSPNYSAGVTASGAVVKGPRGNNVTLQVVLRDVPCGSGLSVSKGHVQTESRASAKRVCVGGPAAVAGRAAYGSAQRSGGEKGYEGPVALPRLGAKGFEFPGGGLLTPDQAQAQAHKLQVLTLNQAQAQARKLEALGRQQHSEEMHRLLVDLGIALAIVASLSLGLGWFLAGRLLRPLQTITKTARAISAKSLHRRLALRGPRDELREVGDTFDELLERLERSFEAQRQFVANASHELRTPLTLERAVVEVALADPRASNETLRATCERVLAIGEQQERMIDALLALARSERGLEREEPFDLGRLVGETVAAREPDLAARGLALEGTLESAPTSGEERLAERLVANLVDNAMQHNVEGGWVRVDTAAIAGRAVLTVSNSGPVVPASEVERLFRPFQRIGTARVTGADGHGLGLSIVSAIADAHGAELQARARPEGGLEITVGFVAGDVARSNGAELMLAAARPA